VKQLEASTRFDEAVYLLIATVFMVTAFCPRAFDADRQMAAPI
jgi:hypothetical protein